MPQYTYWKKTTNFHCHWQPKEQCLELLSETQPAKSYINAQILPYF